MVISVTCRGTNDSFVAENVRLETLLMICSRESTCPAHVAWQPPFMIQFGLALCRLPLQCSVTVLIYALSV